MSLLRFEESGQEKTHQLKSGNTVVGRLPTSDLVLSDPSVSRRHAIVRVADGRLFVQDAASRFGTFLNGQRLMPTDDESPAAPGDKLKFGEVSVSLEQRVAEQALLTEGHQIAESRPGDDHPTGRDQPLDGGVDRRRAA